jgi:hypothetical protein
MRVEFFNFGNDETFHFFRWVTDGGRVNPDELVVRALSHVEGDDWFAMGVDVSTVAKDKLADILNEIVDELSPVDESDEIGQVGADPEALFNPLLKLAIGRIDLHAVAQAMLIRAGKWAPDRERPDLK